jgi:hypothetical protein
MDRIAMPALKQSALGGSALGDLASVDTGGKPIPDVRKPNTNAVRSCRQRRKSAAGLQALSLEHRSPSRGEYCGSGALDSAIAG